MKYNVRMVHRISPSDRDVAVVECEPDRRSILAALKRARLHSGRVREVRREGERVVVFPFDRCGNWHALILEPS